jgi:hypothetical protein
MEQRRVVNRAVLRPAVGVVNQPRRRLVSQKSTAQGLGVQAALQAVTRDRADDVPEEEAQHDGEV